MPSRKGSPDKRKQALIALLQQKYPGYQPVMEIAESAFKLTKLAKEAEASEDAAFKSEAAALWKDAGAQHDRVAKYTTPQLKAVEVTGEDGGPIHQNWTVEFINAAPEDKSKA